MAYEILIVEDETVAAMDLAANLEHWGYRVSGPCADGATALAVAERQRPDLALMDIQLAGPQNGVALATQLKARWGIPVVYLTAFATPAVIEQAKATEPLAYVIKPYTQRGLRVTLEMAVAKLDVDRRLHDALAELGQFKHILDNTHEAVFIFDPHTLRYLYANEGACAQLWYSRAELLRMHCYECKPEFTEAQFRDRLAPLLDGSKPSLRFETVHRRKDGADLPVEVYLQLVSPPGEPARVVNICTDVSKRLAQRVLAAGRAKTERHAASRIKEQLQLESVAAEVGTALNSAEELGPMLDNCATALAHHPAVGAAGIWTLGDDGQTLELAAGVGRDMAPREWQRRLPIDNRTIGQVYRNRSRLFGALAANEQNGLAPEAIASAGLMQMAGYPLVIEHAAVGVLAVYTRIEVTSELQRGFDRVAEQIALGIHRKQLQTAARASAEQRIRASYENLQEVLDGSVDAVLIVDENHGVRFANRAAQALFNKRVSLGADVGVLLRHEEGDELDVPQMDGSIKVVETRTGETNWFGESCAIMIFRDVTQHRQDAAKMQAAHEEALRANQAKSEFLSHMSHELRTPLNAVLGFAQILQLESLSAEQRGFVHEIHRAGSHLLKLITELLDLSRIESGKLAVQLEAVQVQPLAVAAARLVDGLVNERQLTLAADCAGCPLVRADPTRLKQILVNLLANAAKYNRNGGRIDISCRPLREDWVRIAVRDTGLGIAPEKIGRLFVPFERLGAEASSIEGTGIGLALCAQLADLMGGKIGVESTPGAGSTFWLDLRQADTAAPLAAVGPPPHQPGGAGADQAVVVYVEDNAANLAVVQGMLRQRHEWRLVCASTGKEGLALIRQHRPAVVLLDIHLPDLDGYAVLRALQADPATRHIPVLALSADAMPDEINKGLAAGVLQYLTKPIQMGALLRAIETALGRAP